MKLIIFDYKMQQNQLKHPVTIVNKNHPGFRLKVEGYKMIITSYLEDFLE
jgi:hypothetical protein